MDESKALICAWEIAPDGGAEARDWAALDRTARSGSWLWVHLDSTEADTRAWLLEKAGLDGTTVEALLALETRPRMTATPDGTLVILRGVNLNPQADPEDMISIRLWVTPERIISTRRRRLMAVDDIRRRAAAGDAPPSPGEFLVDLAGGLVDRANGVVQDLEEEVEALEREAGDAESAAVRPRLIAARHRIIPLRRYLAPQRDALSQLLAAKLSWLDEAQRWRLRETADRVTRFVEELDALRERAEVIQDTIRTHLAEDMNRTMMILSVVAAIFLPLGLLTGLLGINVAGIPGAETPFAFWLVCIAMALVAVFEIWLFRRLKLL